MRDTSFKEYLEEQLAELENLQFLYMFGGWGIYTDSIFFGIISGGKLYFKTHTHTRENYEREGMRPFRPSAKQMLKNYYEVPPNILENPRELAKWAREAARQPVEVDKKIISR